MGERNGAQQLSIKESLLGLLQSRDIDGSGIIHSSDFKACIDDLELKMGDPIVQSLLVYCTIDTKGSINFGNLGRALQTERELLKKQSYKPHVATTSQATPSQPWRSDKVHQQKVERENSVKLLQTHRVDIQQAYQQYVGNTATEEEFVNYIISLGIAPTQNFQHLLRKNRCCISLNFT